MFQIDLMNFFKTRLILSEQLHWQPSEIDRLPYYEYEISLEEYDKILKERKEAQDKQNAEQSGAMGDPTKMGNSMLKNAQSSIKMPTMPSLPSFSMPSL